MKNARQFLPILFLAFGSLLIGTRAVHAQTPSASPAAVQDSTEAPRDSSHVLISAIKSVSGEIPENEFFAINWRVKYSRAIFTLANVDIALSNIETNEVTSPGRELTEGGISGNVDVSGLLRLPHRQDHMRSIFAGVMGKIFNTEAYYGPVLGSIELHQSAFFSSYFLAGYLRRFFPVTPTTNVLASGERLADDNLYTEFLIHSSKVNFFRYLAVKGGVLIPLLGRRGEFDDVQFRITIAVPVGQPIKF